MFSLSEKVDGAVSVKYQMPGEELDPESLISVNDDGDIKVGAGLTGLAALERSECFCCRAMSLSSVVEPPAAAGGGCRRAAAEPPMLRWRQCRRQCCGAAAARVRTQGPAAAHVACRPLPPATPVQELFGEYHHALRLPGTPIKTFRLRLFLFPAAEEPVTPEDLAFYSHSSRCVLPLLGCRCCLCGLQAAAAAAACVACRLPGQGCSTPLGCVAAVCPPQLRFPS